MSWSFFKFAFLRVIGANSQFSQLFIVVYVHLVVLDTWLIMRTLLYGCLLYTAEVSFILYYIIHTCAHNSSYTLTFDIDIAMVSL